MASVLLVTPPFVQPNTAYPATAYLKSYLNSIGITASQADLSIELLNKIFSPAFLDEVFMLYGKKREAGYELGNIENLDRIFSLRNSYTRTIDSVIEFLRGKDTTLANTICMPDFLPQAGRFENIADLEQLFGSMGLHDCAKYISTLYLQDLSDLIRAAVTEHFEIIKYGEKLAASVPDFEILERELQTPLNIIEQEMLSLLRSHIENSNPDAVSFTIPFPGNLLSALRCAQYIKQEFPKIKTIAGGGYPTTELRSMSAKKIYDYFDHIILDDGEIALASILQGRQAYNTYSRDGFNAIPDNGAESCRISHKERGCPDFEGLPFDRYFSVCESTNPMHRLWSDGKWNKMMLAHGCYWSKCSFCDTSLDYIGCYDSTVDTSTLVDWMERIATQTGSKGFHFTDEAAPPKLLKELSLEILRRGLTFTWWTNIRFENSYTIDLCKLMAAAGCIAVSGGLEVASDRLLKLINKGISIETATIAMRNFFYSGIMVHSYLMYGLPTQTLQETVDALEVVRQLYKAQLIESGFWHRYAMTVHSHSGKEPDIYGVKRKNNHVNTFANNEVAFVEDRRYNIQAVGEGLRLSLHNFMSGQGIDKPVHKWFDFKAPQTTVENTLITDHLIKPDSSRIFDESARIVWIGASQPVEDETGLNFIGNSSSRHINLSSKEAGFIIEAIKLCGEMDKKIKLTDLKQMYSKVSEEPFAAFYHSKKWDRVREYGLLQI